MEDLTATATRHYNVFKAKVTAFFSTPASEGYHIVPSSYGSIPVQATAANGLQSLPSDATKIEPKVDPILIHHRAPWLTCMRTRSGSRASAPSSTGCASRSSSRALPSRSSTARRLGTASQRGWAWVTLPSRLECSDTRGRCRRGGGTGSSTATADTTVRAGDPQSNCKLTLPPETDEIYGPVAICALIFVAVLLNFILRVNQRFVAFPASHSA